MNVGQSILEALQANTALMALVGSRLWQGKTPSGGTDALGPWITFQRISNSRTTAHDGDGRLSMARWQFTIGSTDKELVDQAAEVLGEINGTEFTAASGQLVTFLHIDDRDDYADAPRTHTTHIDFQVTANL